MAISKIWKVISRLDRAVKYVEDEEKTRKQEEEFYEELNKVYDYATNKDKTELQYYVTGINCVPEIAVQEMICTKKQFGKTDKILGYHAVQSFPKDEVTPEIAHEIGIKLANEVWGDRFEVVVTTHLNTENLHNHFVLNSVSFADGKKYNDCHATYAFIRETNDNLCREYGLSVIEEKTTKAGINYQNFMRGKYQNSSYYQTSKIDIDKAIGQAYSYKDFENILSKMGYTLTYRANKLSVCREGYKRNIRIERAFGSEYTIDRLNERILEENDIRVPFHEVWKRKRYYPKYHSRKKIQYYRKHRGSYCLLFVLYRHKLRQYQSPKYKKKLTDRQREEIKIMNQYSEKIRFMSRNEIHSAEDLFSYKQTLNDELEKLESQRRKLNKEFKQSNYTDENIMEEKNEVYEKIKIVRKEVQICKEIECQIPKIKEELKQDYIPEKAEYQDKEVDDIERSRRSSR